jgi:hypothetical protein
MQSAEEPPVPSASPSAAVATIAEMTTPALLILGSASLAASALVRMARIVDRARVLASLVHDGDPEKAGTTSSKLRAALERHAVRARHAERSIALLYAAIVVFVGTCLTIVVVHAMGYALEWVPVVLAVIGTGLLLAGSTYMVVECRLGREQIAEEIREAMDRLQGERP